MLRQYKVVYTHFSEKFLEPSEVFEIYKNEKSYIKSYCENKEYIVKFHGLDVDFIYEVLELV